MSRVFHSGFITVNGPQMQVKTHPSEGSKSSTHYLNDKNRFDVSSKGPLSGISVGGRGKHTCFYPRANGAKRRSGSKPGARVTNSTQLFTPGEKDSIADSKVGVIVGWVVISLISKIWMFIRSGRGKKT